MSPASRNLSLDISRRNFEYDVQALRGMVEANPEIQECMSKDGRCWFDSQTPTLEDLGRWPGIDVDRSRVRGFCALKLRRGAGQFQIPRIDIRFWRLRGLRKLDLSKGLFTELHRELDNLQELEELKLNECIQLTQLPATFGNLRSLGYLSIGGCRGLLELPDSFGRLSSLRRVDMWSCLRLSCLPEDLTGLISLKTLVAKGCVALEDVTSVQQILALESLVLTGCTSLLSLPQALEDLPALRHLEASGCPQLESSLELRTLQQQLLRAAGSQ